MSYPSLSPHGQQTLDLFQECTGHSASHLAFAPGRVNLIGEYTDFNHGFVLPFAIKPGVYAAGTAVEGRKARLFATQRGCGPVEFEIGDPGRDSLNPWSNYVRGVIAGMVAAGVPVPGLDIMVHADLPVGGGLSSSAALEVSVATLIEHLSGSVLDPVQKALICQKAEHEYAGTPCGIMDQFAVTFSLPDHLLLIDCASLQCQLVPMPQEGVSLLVINSLIRHALNDGGYQSRRDDCEEACRILEVPSLRHASLEEVEASRSRLHERVFRRARHVVSENVRTLAAVAAVSSADWEQVGQLLYQSHGSLRDDMEVSCPEVDFIVETASNIGLSGGLYGCRMTGGGFGGCCIALVRQQEAGAISEILRHRYLEKTGIDPVIFLTTPSAGASLLRPVQNG